MLDGMWSQKKEGDGFCQAVLLFTFAYVQVFSSLRVRAARSSCGSSLPPFTCPDYLFCPHTMRRLRVLTTTTRWTAGWGASSATTAKGTACRASGPTLTNMEVIVRGIFLSMLAQPRQSLAFSRSDRGPASSPLDHLVTITFANGILEI